MSSLPSQQQTLRQTLQALLREQEFSALELSAQLGIPEKQVYGHMEHLSRSLQTGPHRLKIVPAQCLSCDFSFVKRNRLTPPGRCPLCRSTHITAPRYSIK